MRRVIGAEHVDDPLAERGPERRLVGRAAHRRIHLGIRAEPLVTVRRFEGEMVRRDLDRRDVFVAFEKRHLLLGGDVQNMHALAGLARNPDQPLGRGEREPHRATGCVRITGDAPLALAQPELIPGMERSAPAGHAEKLAQRIVVLDQERAATR